MNRQKIVIKPKPCSVDKSDVLFKKDILNSDIIPKTIKKAEPSKDVPLGRIYTLGGNKKSPATLMSSNNIIQLQLYLVDIKSIESKLNIISKDLMSSIDDKPILPKPWNELNVVDSVPNIEIAESGPISKKDPFKALIKRTNVEFKDDSSNMELISRKDLIINSGVKRQSKQLLQVFAKEWPAHSPYACWVDCHTFNTTPVGIPHSFIDGVFYCYGNFCSYNCGKRYLCPNVEDDDDISMMQTINDIFIMDDKSEKLQLLELLCHIETGNPLNEPIRMSSKRMTLKLFGGDKTIEDYRNGFNKNTTYHIFKSPLIPISYLMEECSTKGDTRKKARVISLDTLKIQKAFDLLMQEKDKNNTVLHKMLKSGSKIDTY